MKRLKTKTFAFLLLLPLIHPAIGRAADALIVSTTTVPSSTPPKRHHHHKKIISDAAIGKSSDTASGTSTTHVGLEAGNGIYTGVSNDSKAGSIGSPNMASPDHTPGTTGTSGQ